MTTEYFEIEQAIEKYGIKNIRVFYPNTKMDYNLANMFLAAHVGIVLSGSDNPEEMVMHTIDEKVWKEQDGFKIRLNPEDRYKMIQFNHDKSNGVEVPIYLPTRRMYTSDFNTGLRQGHGSVYVLTEDGYQLIYSVVKEVVSEETIQALHWGANVLNSMRFHN